MTVKDSDIDFQVGFEPATCHFNQQFKCDHYLARFLTINLPFILNQQLILIEKNFSK